MTCFIRIVSDNTAIHQHKEKSEICNNSELEGSQVFVNSIFI